MQDDLRQGPKNIYFVDTARDLYLKAHTFFVCPGSVKILILCGRLIYLYLQPGKRWQCRYFFNLKIMIGIYIFWGVMTILSFSLWFIARAAWIQDTPDKNKCFWVCLVGTILIQFLLFAAVDTVRPKTTLPTEKVKIIINSNIPRDSIELIVNSNYEAYSTDLP